MKIIVAGSTGFIATELIRQALSDPAVSSIVALARRPTTIPHNTGPSADAAKLKSVICEDFMSYPESVKLELAEADACIWLIAVTPSKLKTVPWEEARKICFDYTVTGIETMSQLPRASAGKPFRFIYTSGANAVRDPSQKPWVLGNYSLMRGEAELYVLDYAKRSGGTVEACVAKPGLIDAPGRTGLVKAALLSIARYFIGLPKVDVRDIAATLLEQAVKGLEKDTLLNDDLIRIGQRALMDQ